ncbi:MAG: hypothetical protein A2289_07375 [Deltaproteobacteria bacterium RIFOXYA12_FULL_58_15]|nr:MAG: hypothetical protein A2289_07375 [Deltaproteobacteria bacterium RIFOXYA12_FULL_58_15]
MTVNRIVTLCVLLSACACAQESAQVPSRRCGNGVIEAPEVCDNEALAGLSCVDFGMLDGTLRCQAGCGGLDLSECERDIECGDGRAEASELCDGLDLRGEECVDHGFLAGTLRCAEDCGGYDTSLCFGSGNCGNGEIDADDDEICDGDSLGGALCADFGFTTGTLSCGTGCTSFDVSGCLTGQPCASDGGCTGSLGRCDPVWRICVACIEDADCSCHETCAESRCEAIGAQSLGMRFYAHGMWQGMTGQPGHEFLGWCEGDSDCDGDEMCNPATGGCVPQSAVGQCVLGCAADSFCDTDSGRCFPAAACDTDRNCCGAPGLACNGDGLLLGLCLEQQCTSPQLITAACPLAPKLESECEGADFCSSTGHCVACVCDAECPQSAPQCDVLTGECMAVGFCREPADCSGEEVCDSWTHTCVTPCASSAVCTLAQACDPVEFVCRCVPDAYEPNERASAASLPALSWPVPGAVATVVGTLCELDEDWFEIMLEAGDGFGLSGMTRTGLEATVRLWAPDGSLVRSTAIGGSPIDVVVTATGLHRVQVGGDGTGDYVLTVRHAMPQQCDALGVDDVPSLAIPLNGESMPSECELSSGNLQAAHTVRCDDVLEICQGELDYYVFSAFDGSTATVTLANFSSGDLDLMVYGPFAPSDPLATTMMAGSSTTENPVETVSVATRLEARYLVVVAGFFNSFSPYDLEISISQSPLDPSCSEDVYDVITATPLRFDVSGFNDSPERASGIALSPDLPTDLQLSLCADDSDWFVLGSDAGTLVPIPAGHLLRAEVIAADPGPLTVVNVAIGSDPAAVSAMLDEGIQSSTTMTADGGLLYVASVARANAMPQSYTLRLEELEPSPCDLDDLGDLDVSNRNDLPSDATPLTNPPWPVAFGDPTYTFPADTSSVLSLCAADVDWYRIDNLADVRVVAGITYDSSLVDLGLAIYDARVAAVAPASPTEPPAEGLLAKSELPDSDEQVVAADTGSTAYLLVYNRSGWPSDYALTVATSSIGIYTDNTVVDIPDDGGSATTCGGAGAISRTIDIAAVSRVVDVDVEVDITHTFTGDLQIFVQLTGASPGPGEPAVDICVPLSLNNGSGGNHFTGTIFDDEADVGIAVGSAPFTGRYRPQMPLTAFDGLPLAGAWTLWVGDSMGTDTGTLNSWSLSIERWTAQ